jgi:hypothetical protein
LRSSSAGAYLAKRASWHPDANTLHGRRTMSAHGFPNLRVTSWSPKFGSSHVASGEAAHRTRALTLHAPLGRSGSSAGCVGVVPQRAQEKRRIVHVLRGAGVEGTCCVKCTHNPHWADSVWTCVEYPAERMIQSADAPKLRRRVKRCASDLVEVIEGSLVCRCRRLTQPGAGYMQALRQTQDVAGDGEDTRGRRY